ncbi:hypothetical protein FHS55_000407 [Angulomicrobium tetraedrale]|uniref:Uncharacterized protein n=1 Tax=Ancylobacter tetraedralis TaxID=217068 RepID=A0A839Z4H2_9HYPH|nr:hypothetical protein [Ancylobacter tetraedralis]
MCETFRPIFWTADDSDETVRQAKAHNAVGREICGWRG